jgi:hypothetical protein
VTITRRYQLTKDERRALDWGYLNVVLTCGHLARLKKVKRRLQCRDCREIVESTGVLVSSGALIPIDEVHRIRALAWARRLDRREKHYKNFRRTLEADPHMTPELVDKAVMQYRWDQLKDHAGEERYRRIRERLEGPKRLDDSKHRPTPIDSLLTGSLRVSGETAQAVKRGRTITDWQYNDRLRRGA